LLKTLLSALSAEEAFIKGSEEGGEVCNSQAQALKRVKEWRAEFSRNVWGVCAAAARGHSRPGDYWKPGEYNRLIGRQ